MLTPRESGAFIAAHSRHVRVNDDGIENAVSAILEALQDKSFSAASWGSATKLHPIAKDENDRAAIDWCFFANTINFSFWSENKPDAPGKFCVTYKNETYDGWYACCALINRALDNGIPFTDANYLRRLTFEQCKTIFLGDEDVMMPMLSERKSNLIEAAEVLVNNFDGTFANCVKTAGHDAQKLLKLIVDNFPSFRDTAVYNGTTVSFLKRAQILVADVFGCMNDPVVKQNGIDTLTMFADYRVPQVLASFEALEYSPELKKLLRNRHMFNSGDPMEVEIRGCSIHAVEQIVSRLHKRLAGQTAGDNVRVNAASVDNFLWCYRRQHAEKLIHIPFHRVRCIYY